MEQANTSGSIERNRSNFLGFAREALFIWGVPIGVATFLFTLSLANGDSRGEQFATLQRENAELAAQLNSLAALTKTQNDIVASLQRDVVSLRGKVEFKESVASDVVRAGIILDMIADLRKLEPDAPRANSTKTKDGTGGPALSSAEGLRIAEQHVRSQYPGLFDEAMTILIADNQMSKAAAERLVSKSLYDPFSEDADKLIAALKRTATRAATPGHPAKR